MMLQHRCRTGGGLGPPILTLAVLCLATAAPVHAAEPEPLNVEQVIEAVSVRVQSIHMSMDLQFDELMRPQRPHHQMRIALVIEHDPELEVRGLEDVALTAARTSMGERLEQPEQAMDRHVRRRQHLWDRQHRVPAAWGMRGVGRPRLDAQLELNYPSRPADRFEQLVGRVQLRIAGGEPRRAVLGPFHQIRGQRVRIADYEHGRLRVDHDARHGPGHVGVRMPAAFADAVNEIRFFNARSRELPADYGGAHMEGDNVTLIYRVALPDDGQIVVAFHERVDTFDVPFDLEDVALPTPPPPDWGIARRDR